MPFRQLPQTDSARLQALQAAANKAATVDPAELAFSSESKTLLDTVLPQWKQETEERGQALSAQSEASSAARDQKARLRMWLSHFFQNLNMGIEREVFQASDRAFYQMDVSQTTLPDTTTEADLLMWADRLVVGEAARTGAGGTAIPFPTVAEVEAELTQCRTLCDERSAKKDAFDKEQEDVEAMRDQVDGLIRDIWDEVEFAFRREQPSSLRRKAREYGVYYALRPNEEPEPEES